MALITTAEERMKERTGIKGVIFGPYKIGKTSLLWTLPQETTLFVDMEAGGLAVEGWKGDSIDVYKTSQAMGLHPWTFCRHLAVLIGGPSPSVSDPNRSYSEAHFEEAKRVLGDPSQFQKYDTFFIDSITVAGRMSFSWCRTQPEAFSEKTGKPDTRGAYGLHGQEMITWMTHIQHVRNKNVWFVGILDQRVDDYNQVHWEPQIEGSKAGREIPGIMDQVVSMVEMETEGTRYRAFVCQRMNPWGYPAGDRSGRLDMVEEPHLGRLMDKMLNQPRQDAEKQYGLPQTTEGEKE